jgi:hypothetical protein
MVAAILALAVVQRTPRTSAAAAGKFHNLNPKP